MSKRTSKPIPSTSQSQQFTPASMLPQAQSFWSLQEHILSESEVFWRNWLQRRHEAVHSMQTLLEEAGSGGAPGTALPWAVMNWQSGSARRLMQDFDDWSALCRNCAGYMAEAEGEVGNAILKEAEELQEAARPAKHATPV